ncbi:hypothetical protein DCC81_10105 [Chitinophaga parva]|uniref:Uncharacterized protein n=1 Tax=Chitinophaga parva TaxID=2169414 RepID=A0A2T7BQ11_9BACT|nr:beta-galactosidase [Chitinophaga parva]PUZ29767.1 hypothetical protein DCC81_10105 [Chitinophaga parva]
MWRKLFFVAAICGLSGIARAQSNDHMFTGAPAAKSFIDVDAHGFTINGKRTFLVSAGLEYARIPHELWKDRLLRLKRDGFNCVEIYTFWNFHEAQEGQFSFSGDHDLDAFLKLVKQLDMYCIARVGPYYCAEWDFGGYPHWLRFKPGMVARTADTTFVKYVDRFFDKLLPIVAKNQIHKGGAVILVQLENEHPSSWGSYLANDYFKHLQQTALRLGVEVPYFFSGMHHGHDPAEDKKDLFDPKRPSPWFSSEYWSVWFDKYGSGQAESDVFGRRTWKIITRGGNGYNVYMAHGGTNFGYTNDDEDAASYDYGAALGQTGDLRPMYYQFKRNALFARSFESILENSHASHQFDDIAGEQELGITTRSSDAGDIISLDNNNAEESRVTYVNINDKAYPSAGKLVLDPMEILPLVHQFRLGNNVTVDWAITRILGVQKTGHTTTIVAYGKLGSYGDILFQVKGKVTLQNNAADFHVTGQQLALQLTYAAGKPNVYSFHAGDETIRIVALDTQLADRTWFINENGINAVVTGPAYLADIWKANGQLHITAEQPWYGTVAPSAHTWVYDDGGETTLNNGPLPTQFPNQLPLTADWIAHDATIPAAAGFNDKTWLASETPLQMGADGDTSAYAWYRVRKQLPAAGLYTVDISKGNGRYIAFLDGEKVAEGNASALSFTAKKGAHTLAIFATHDGRDKLVSYVGKLDLDVKGIAGTVLLHYGAIPMLSQWKFLAGGDSAQLPASYLHAVNYRAGKDAFDGHKGNGWFHTSIAAGADAIFFNSVDDNAVVYINGRKAGTQNGWGVPFSVAVPKDLKTDSIAIDVFVRNDDGRGGLDAKIKAVYKADQVLTGWRMRGGPGTFEAFTRTVPTPPKGSTTGTPIFYKTTFKLDGIPAGVHPMWRVTFKGLSHGFIWVNGHNLGRYPEVLPVDGLYIPECWLREGQNELVVFDEYGNSPAAVQIKAEQQASRAAYDISEATY